MVQKTAKRWRERVPTGTDQSCFEITIRLRLGKPLFVWLYVMIRSVLS